VHVKTTCIIFLLSIDEAQTRERERERKREKERKRESEREREKERGWIKYRGTTASVFEDQNGKTTCGYNVLS